ncbi:MAG TPA: hypothetical protein VL404_05275 [Candidatus Eisenbacteria bacterium]|nr:hypothetical protein [Candidatus Eisenbacteria bacterium]
MRLAGLIVFLWIAVWAWPAAAAAAPVVVDDETIRTDRPETARLTQAPDSAAESVFAEAPDVGNTRGRPSLTED